MDWKLDLFWESASNKLFLENGHFIKCFGGLTETSNSISCSQPLFDTEEIVGTLSSSNNNNKMLGLHNSGNQYAAGHSWLKDEVAVLFGSGTITMTVSMNEGIFSGAGSNTNEWCYKDNQLMLYVDNCNGHSPGSNGGNVMSSFTFTYSSGVSITSKIEQR